MIDVKLRHHANCNPYRQISWSAKNCYNPTETAYYNGFQFFLAEFFMPKRASKYLLGVENQLFLPAHHTTHSHFGLTYFIENVSVSTITLGIHLLSNPFSNSEQRSGRFCIKMFLNPNYEQIEKYIRYYWPELSDVQVRNVINFVKNGISIFQNNLEKGTEIAAEFIRKERPFASEKYIRQNAPKFAQEQLRNFVSTIFPTGDTYSLTLLSVISNYATAWTPPMIDLTQKLVNPIVKKWPEMSYAFERQDRNEYFIKIAHSHQPEIVFEPNETIFDLKIHPKTVYPEFEELHPVDKMFYHPKFMNNKFSELISAVEISVATMGQDQRHRMIDHGEPEFTGDFYLPPVARELGLEKQALSLQQEWLDFYTDPVYPKTLVNTIALYGAVVVYEKKSNFCALPHEQIKRLCFNTQEEIFNLNLQKRGQSIEKVGEDHPMINMFSPTCVCCGKCTEGSRYCGRDLKQSPFIKRQV